MSDELGFEAYFESEEGKVPEIDLRKLNTISSLITTFERKDLKTNNIVTFYYDNTRDYVFLELLSTVNNKVVIDDVMGYDKDKILALCQNVIDFFKNSKTS